MEKRFFIFIILILFTAGCATTEYTQREGSFWGSGYYDKKIQDGIYKVGYTGNTSTMPDMAEDLALLRAADVTLQNGYNYFTVVDRAKAANLYSSYTPLLPYTYKGRTYYSGGYSTTTATPDTELTIHCYTNKPLDTKETIYEASEIKANLGNKYKKNNSSSGKVANNGIQINPPSKPSQVNSGGMSAEDKAAAEGAFDAALGHS